jgi:RnfABCDGE-type electron transport complex B subunit
MTTLLALASLGGLGLVLSIILVIAQTKLAIEVSEKQKKILSVLPGANCGACGFPGCEAMAEALAKNGIEAGFCPVGGQAVMDKIAKILGTEAKKVEPKVAVLRCQGGRDKTTQKFKYVGPQDCVAANLVQGGPISCRYGCLGFGNCVDVCPFNAITMGENRLPVISDEKCTGCGICVEECPRNLLELIPKSQKIFVACSSSDKAKVVRESCKTGCIACKICEKNCPYDAIKVENNCARINFEKCQNCGICVVKCPRKCIADKQKSRPKAMIGTECTGCGECVSVCPMNAISGEKGKQHTVDLNKCIGCGLCYKVCKHNAITMAFALGYKEAA